MTLNGTPDVWKAPVPNALVPPEKKRRNITQSSKGRRSKMRHNVLVNTLSARYQGLDDIHVIRSEEHTSELQSLIRISYAVFCLKKKKHIYKLLHTDYNTTSTHTLHHTL